MVFIFQNIQCLISNKLVKNNEFLIFLLFLPFGPWRVQILIRVLFSPFCISLSTQNRIVCFEKLPANTVTTYVLCYPLISKLPRLRRNRLVRGG